MKKLLFLLYITGSLQAQYHFRLEDPQNYPPIISPHGAAFADFNNDGWQDLFIGNAYGPPLLLLNQGQGKYKDITSDAGLPLIYTSTHGAWADINNDGLLDLFVAGFTGPDALLLNLGGGKFKDISANLPATPTDKMTYGAAWGDYDRDGYVDLFVHNFTVSAGDRLLRNRGDLHFEDVTIKTWLYNGQAGKTRMAAWCDYDRDGDPDLYTGGQIVQTLYRNFGGEFIPTELDRGSDAKGASWIDYNGDGRPDLNICYLYGRLDNVWINAGEGGLWPPASLPAIDLFDGLVNIAWGDFDNDGDLDALAIGDPPSGRAFAAIENDGANSFRDVTARSGIDPYFNGYCLQCGDLNNDGYLDLYISDRFTRRGFIYLNDAGQNGWLTLQLQGVQSNQAGIGALVDLYAGGRHQFRQVGNPTLVGQHTLLLHFGLGSAVKADSLIIHWPSGIEQRLTDVPAWQSLTVVEEGKQVGVETHAGLSPGLFALAQNWPNPFNAATRIEFDLSGAADVQLQICNLAGDLVTTLVDGPGRAGRQTLIWDGRDQQGRAVAGGVYLLRLRSGHISETRKMLLLR